MNEKIKTLECIRGKVNCMAVSTKNSVVKLIAVIIIAIISFLFIHSELEQFSLEEDNHDTHDYCHIVKDASTQASKVAPPDIFKLRAGNLFSIVGIDDRTFKQSKIKTLTLLNYHLPQKSNEIYLLNQAFLI